MLKSQVGGQANPVSYKLTKSDGFFLHTMHDIISLSLVTQTTPLFTYISQLSFLLVVE